MRARHRINVVLEHLRIAQPETDQRLDGCIGVCRPLQHATFLKTRHMSGKCYQGAGLRIPCLAEGREVIDKECSRENETNQRNKERQSPPAWSARVFPRALKRAFVINVL